MKSFVTIWSAAVLLLLGLPLASHAADGAPGLTNFFNGTGNGSDQASDIAVDSSGNVYVTGYATANASTRRDYATIKYSSDGVPAWTQYFNGPANGNDEAKAIGVDANGNVYVTGTTTGNGTTNDITTLKYSSSGVLQWSQVYNSALNGIDDAADMAVDASGNVYVTGTTIGSGTAKNFVTIKYSTAGAQQWVQIFNGAINGDDEASAIAIDGSGNVYVTGTMTGSGTGDDIATVKYSSAGAPQWTQIFNGAINGDEHASDIAVDSSGNVYVTGTTTGSGTGNNFVTIKYSSAGAPQWTQIFNGAFNGNDEARAIAVDGSGNVYVTGKTFGNGTTNDFATIKYSSAGVAQWTQFFNGVANSSDEPSDLAVDNSGNVFVTGKTFGNGTGNDFATLKYSTTGTAVWTNFFKGGANGEDVPNAIAVGAGNVYVTGSTTNSASGLDFATIQYSLGIVPVPEFTLVQTLPGKLVLGWDANAATLQSAAVLTGPFTNVSGAISPYTNDTTQNNGFFRLSAK